MKKLKRTLVIILSLVLVIGAATGCGKSQTATNTPEFELKMAIPNAPGSEAEQHVQAVGQSKAVVFRFFWRILGKDP